MGRRQTRLAAPLVLVAAWGCWCSEELGLRTQPGQVKATLCDPVTGARAPGHLLRVDARDGNHEGESRSDGTVTVGGVPPGDITIRLLHNVPGQTERRTDLVQPERMADSGELEVLDPACIDIPLAPGRGAIQGQVCNRHTGQMVTSAEVTATSNAGGPLTTTTGEGGFFLLPDVPAGDWVVTIRGAGYQRAFNARVEAGAVTVLPLGGNCRPFDPGGTGSIGGKLCIENGSGPWSGALVTVLLPDGSVMQDSTDVNGEFLLEGVPPGERLVSITGGGETATYTVTVNAGETAAVGEVVDCPVPDRTLTGDIRGQLCDPDQGGWLVGAVAETLQPPRTFRDHTDERGRFHLAGLTPGEVTVTVTKGAYLRVFTVPVSAGTEVTVADGVCAPPTWQCHDTSLRVEDAAPLRIMLVVDKSGSMEEDGLDGQKWGSAVSALEQVTAQLTSTAAFGLMLFPAGDAFTASCDSGTVEVAPAVGNASDIAFTLESTGPGGGTPTGQSIQVVHQWLVSHPADSRTIAILATDGVPNCNSFLDGSSCSCPVPLCPGSPVACCQSDPRECCLESSAQCLDDQATITAIRAMAQSDIPTYVIGLPGSQDPTDVLTRMAQAGGTTAGAGSAYYFPTSAAQLADDVANIVTTNRSCRFELDAAPNDPQLMDVQVNGATVARDPGRRQGWDLVGAKGVELFGAACDTLRATSSSTVDIHYCTDA
ncbi:MAG: carboxypeptidase regulatory-like domain-containing protein [Deltaproteobacteria bacterium]|nr:carboxypeptidase regulatory-like domain-containing protein [Deltaproteobacteria bacterium]